jgi:phage head maturation protease
LRLTEDDIGLRYEIEPPDTEQARGVLASVERGDVSGSSFAFIPTRTGIIEEEGRTVREVRAVELFDVGPVTYPAYPATTSGVRGVDAEAIRAEIRSHRATGADLVRDQIQATMFSNAVNIAADLARAGLRTDI